jgi:hypothetical protein
MIPNLIDHAGVQNTIVSPGIKQRKEGEKASRAQSM